MTPTLANNVLKFIELTGIATKMAAEELKAKEAQEKRAAELAPVVLEAIKTCTDAESAKRAESMLKDPVATLQLLKSALDKNAELSRQIGRPAASIGHPEPKSSPYIGSDRDSANDAYNRILLGT